MKARAESCLLAFLTSLAGCGGSGEEEPLYDAQCPAPSIGPWEAPASSALDETLARLERLHPEPVRPEPDLDLFEDIDATLELWEPNVADRWNRMRLGDLTSWGEQVLLRAEQRLRDDALQLDVRRSLLGKLVALELPGTAAVLGSLLVDEIPADLRALAAHALGSLGGPEVLDTLIFEFRVMYQGDRYYPDDIYERDEYVTLRLGEALARRGNLTALPYLLDLDRRASLGQVLSQWDDSVLAPLIREVLVGILREHLPDVPELLVETPAREELERHALELHAFWQAHGHAPRDHAHPPEPVALDSRLAKRLLRRMVPMRDRPLRPIDEARHVLSSLGVLPLEVLRIGLREPDLFVREYTLDAVERLGPPAAPLAPAVEELLGDASTRTRALDALGSMGTLADVSAWCGLALSPDAELRLLATLALGRLRAGSALPCVLRARERYPASTHPETSMALAFTLVRLGRKEGVALWAELAASAEALDPIRLENLAESTHRELLASELTSVAEFEVGSFFAEVDRLLREGGPSGSFAKPRG